MIPKIIHYCWFGNNSMPKLAELCISSWKKYLPDYELRLWNEQNFNVNEISYVREAYDSKKYAFVTDYVRLYVLYTYGGIYMDTDVEVLKNLDIFLQLPAFTGFENPREVPTGIMASKKNGDWVREQLDSYKGRKFILSDGSMDLTTNVQTITLKMQAGGFLLNNSYQIYKEQMHVFPKDYFCPKESSGLIKLTNNSYCIHHFSGSWQPMRLKVKKFFFRKIVGVKLTDMLVITKKKLKIFFTYRK